jgi:hypothetical protein
MRRTRTWYSVSAPAEFNWRVISLFRQTGVIGLQRSNIDQSGGRAFRLQSCARGIKHDKLRLLIDKNAAASRGERASGSIPDMAIPDQGLPTVYRMIERPASNAIAARAPLQWERKEACGGRRSTKRRLSAEGARDCRRQFFTRWLGRQRSVISKCYLAQFSSLDQS